MKAQDSHVPAFMTPVERNIGLIRILRDVVENRTKKKQRHLSGMPFVFISNCCWKKERFIMTYIAFFAHYC
jgi:hypothetical protein